MRHSKASILEHTPDQIKRLVEIKNRERVGTKIDARRAANNAEEAHKTELEKERKALSGFEAFCQRMMQGFVEKVEERDRELKEKNEEIAELKNLLAAAEAARKKAEEKADNLERALGVEVDALTQQRGR